MAEGIIQWLKQIADNITAGAGGGGATAANQTTANISLSSIDGKTLRPALIPITPVLDTAIYADGDILFDTIVMANTFASATDSKTLVSINVIDVDSEGVGIDFLFFNALQSMGTINAAPSISDANMLKHLGTRSVASSDYSTINGVKIATPYIPPLVLSTGATSLWVAGILRGATPTFAAATDLKFGFGFI